MKAPRVNDRRVEETTGERKRFRSVILPPYMRRSPKVSEVLPLLYLHGLSTGDFTPALEEFFGTGAGLSPASIARLTEQWQKEREARSCSGICQKRTTSMCGLTGYTPGLDWAKTIGYVAW